MTLPVPKLDARTYDDLLSEALRRLPLHTPEYTNHNASDPGRAILEANAFLTETLLYQINRVPDQTYVAFLNLLGVAPRPARAASTDLSFVLKDLKRAADPLFVDIPLGTKVAVDAPDLDEEVVFETDAALRGLNAGIALALVPKGSGGDKWQSVTSFDNEGDRQAQWLHAFRPFSANATQDQQFLFALVLRPQSTEAHSEDVMPSGALDLFVEASEVFDIDDTGEVIEGPVVDVSGPLAPSPDAAPEVTWEVFTGGDSQGFSLGQATGWQSLNVSLDGSEGLRRTGHITLELPSNMTGVNLADAPNDAWVALDRLKVPADKEALVALLREPKPHAEDLKAALTPDTLQAIGISDADQAGMLSDCATPVDLANALDALTDPIDPSALSQPEWAELSPVFAAPDVPMVEARSGDGQDFAPLYFFRATLKTTGGAPRLLNQLRLNTVVATAASTRKDERLGLSNGRPGQSFRLTRAPVYFDPLTDAPDIELNVTFEDQIEPWARVDAFYGYGPADKVYLLDPATGEIRFGDGRAAGIGGAIPPVGAVIRAMRYRFGGGATANVAKGTITAIKGSVANVKEVSNARAAAGGAEGETLEQVMRRAPSTLRRRERAVSAEDFADLARETPGAAIHKAYAVAAKRPEGDGFVDKAGAVSLVVLPDIDHPTPQPNEDVLSAVRNWLNPKRLITTELYVQGPRYFEIQSLTARLRVDSSADFSTVTKAASAALTDWLHPIRGGEAGEGWPFGTDIFHADIYDLLLAVPGVRRVSSLQVAHDTAATGYPEDVIPVPEGFLPALAAGAIGFEVSYV